jgi:hypothetical protein
MSTKTVTKASGKRTKKYDFGERYSLRLTKEAVIIDDKEKNNSIEITLQRLASLLNHISEIDQAVAQFAATQFVKFKQHIGGGWFVSVTSGFPCVDFRKFYMPVFGFEEKPTKSGLAIRLPQWSAFGAALRRMTEDNPHLLQVQTCGIHPNQEEAFQCTECYPFPSVTFGSIIV